MFLFHSSMRPLSLLFAMSLVLGAQDVDIAERLFLSGERAYTTKAYSEAFDTWNQLLQSSPKSPFAAEALLRMARHRLDVDKKPDEALVLLDRLKTDHIKTPFAAEGLLLRGIILASRSHKAQDLKEAVAEFNRVLDLFPDHAVVGEARYQLGLAARTQGQWGRALQHFTEVMRLDPTAPIAPRAQIQAAEIMDIMGDLPGCLRLLQGVRNQYPQAPEAAEAQWRLAVRVKFRLQKPPLRSEGPWPQGKQKWLKTPTLLAMNRVGELIIYQDDLDQAFLLKGTELTPIGAPGKNAKALVAGPNGQTWVLSPKQGLVREDGTAQLLEPYTSPIGAFCDVWGNLWVGDSKATTLGIFPADGSAVRSIPSPSAVGLASLPNGGCVLASDANRSLLFLDSAGQPKITIPYGKEFSAPFKYVVALCSDPLGHVAAIVDGEFEGVGLWGPDGSLLRSATFKSLGLNGKFRAIALDRQGGIILADRSNDVLIRLN
jgi:TolA-binding protein